ncbi:anti-sigma regulatory factor (Ser/Thr protein kinase) [Streptomyces sp. TLI_55]|uniref:ATP-binding protein n=1 Tax=Streptomyces sp. TLI_55 TaxID=1938861 RepID=UPI000BD19F26|nr:ATP-binding protein [Streptomyces sp. TLI_55]SNX62720.1 anti-sigma regulatory factor (Ser/Thr protein kinase) [Streptomyces sp. TLI_55]
MRTHRRTHRRSAGVEYLLPDEAESAGRARKLTSEFLARSDHRRAGLDAEHIDDATLIVSELVTNATRHGGSCRLRLHVSDTQVTVEVYDGSPGRPGVRPLTTWGESGRGLAMVRCLAQHFDIDPVDGGGNRVRAVLAL